jgi:hypothetical protein
MRCPYCVSEIADQALACPHCAHDIYLFKPLQEKIELLERSVAQHEQSAAALADEVAALRAARAEAAQAPAAQAAQADEPGPGAGFVGALFQALIPVLLLLLAAHWVMLFLFDVKPLYLRLATIFIPVPFAALLAMHHPGRLRPAAGAGFGLAFLAVLGMLAITAAIDKVPVLPQDARDWRETLEYVLSIGLAFFTGLLIGEFRAHQKLAELRSNRVALLLARAFVPNEEGKLGIEKAVKKLTKLQEAVTPVATGAASVYAGVKAYLGDLG